MRKDFEIVVRDKVDLFVGNGRFFRTIVEDVLDKEVLAVGIPSYAGMQWDIRKGQELHLAFYRDSGMYIVTVKVVGRKTDNNVEFALLKVTNKPSKQQRREYYRLPVSVPTVICEYQESAEELAAHPGVYTEKQLEKARTVNISMSGAALRVKRSYNIGEKLQLYIYLNWPREGAPPIAVCAEVRRIVPVAESDDMHDIGLQFFEHDENISEKIAKYIQHQQQRQIRQKRLVEGDD